MLKKNCRLNFENNGDELTVFINGEIDHYSAVWIRGEIDENIAKYAVNALQPAKVQSVDVREETREIIVHVNEEQSKIAFGKKAQNVRLCSHLLGWGITIKTESARSSVGKSITEQLKQASQDLANSLEISGETADILIQNGFITREGILEAGLEALLAIENINAEEITDAFARISE